MPAKTAPAYASTRNACKLCAPLGACLAYRGVEGCIPFLHGSQGCATYIRRYVISHFKEPIDIASSSFSEQSAVFGGGANFSLGLANVIRQYQPKAIGIASTCLSETIGDDVSMFLHQFKKEHNGEALPHLPFASTPSYNGSHAEGFATAVKSIVDSIARGGEREDHVNIIASMLSPADLRHLGEICQDFLLPYVLLPDYSDSIDGQAWEQYEKLPRGGTSIASIGKMGCARASIEMNLAAAAEGAGALLQDRFGVENHRIPLPIGVVQTDRFMNLLAENGGVAMPEKYQGERGRLIDAYADAHKYIFEKRAVVYGEPDLVLALSAFLIEIGASPVICATGAKSPELKAKLQALTGRDCDGVDVMDGVDFIDIEQAAKDADPDVFVGSSKGAKIARELQRPLVRVGFPIHDRIGAARLLHIGYRGTQQLFDRIVNAVIETKQESSPVGYFYM